MPRSRSRSRSSSCVRGVRLDGRCKGKPGPKRRSASRRRSRSVSGRRRSGSSRQMSLQERIGRAENLQLKALCLPCARRRMGRGASKMSSFVDGQVVRRSNKRGATAVFFIGHDRNGHLMSRLLGNEYK